MDWQAFLRDSVSHAARRMDEVKPDWWRNIDPIRLNIDSPCDCICGQNDLDFKTLCRDEPPPRDDFLGLTFVIKPFVSRESEPFWLEEIAKRMPPPVREPMPAYAIASAQSADAHGLTSDKEET